MQPFSAIPSFYFHSYFIPEKKFYFAFKGDVYVWLIKVDGLCVCNAFLYAASLKRN